MVALINGPVQAAENPAVFNGQVDRVLDSIGDVGIRTGFEALDDKAGGVPDFVGEIAAGFQSVSSHLHIVAGRGAGGQGKAQGIRAVLFHGMPAD